MTDQNFNYMHNPGYQQVPAYVAPRSNGVATAGMVIGICSLVVPFVGGLLALVGLILSGVGLSRVKDTGSGKGQAIAGLVCSLVAAVLWLILLVAFMNTPDVPVYCDEYGCY